MAPTVIKVPLLAPLPSLWSYQDMWVNTGEVQCKSRTEGKASGVPWLEDVGMRKLEVAYSQWASRVIG